MQYRHQSPSDDPPLEPVDREATCLEPDEPTHPRGSVYQELLPGDLVGGYRIEAFLGSGTMGTVYRAVHPLIGKRVAIKVVNSELAADLEAIARFVREARVVNQIQHRNVIDIFHFDRLPNGQHYLVMEYLDGVSLRVMLEQRGPLPPEQALSILRQVALPIDAAHARGIVHRDLKPDNILLVRDERGEPNMVKLVDFGIASLLDGDHEADTSWLKTQNGAIMGTPGYMSPEQCRGQRVDHCCDIYSLGVVAYQMLTGSLPFRSAKISEVLRDHISRLPPLPSRVNPALPGEVDEVLLRALHKDPGRRYDCAMDLVEELEAALNPSTGEPARVDVTGVTRPVPPSLELSPAVYSLLAEAPPPGARTLDLEPGLRSTVWLPGRTRRSPLLGSAALAITGAGLLFWGTWVGLSPPAPAASRSGEIDVLPPAAESARTASSGAATPAALSLEAIPAGSEIYLDGRPIGAERALQVAPGRHRIALQLPDGPPRYELELVLEPGGSRRLVFDLTGRRWMAP